MVKIIPFKGYYPDSKYANKFTSLPYDVISRNKAVDIVNNNKLSFLKVEKPESNFSKDIKLNNIEIHKKALKNLNEFITKKILYKSKSKNFYLYTQQMDNHIQKGIVACASLNDYSSNKIKKHELTRNNKEIDRINHINITNANTGPVFLIYEYNNKIDNLIEDIILSKQPYINFIATDNNVLNKLWIIEDVNIINNLIEMFKKIPHLYIADGHHRASAAYKVQQSKIKNNKLHNGTESYNFFMSVIFANNNLNIMDYNRVVKDLNGFTTKEILEKIHQNFNIYMLNNNQNDIKNNNIKPKRIGEFVMYLGNKWYKLTYKNKNYCELKKLITNIDYMDVSILQNTILNPILNIKNPRLDKRIDFVGGIKGLEELIKRCHTDCKIAFSLYPISVEQIMSISNNNKLIPPKSTWFEPKLRSGMIIRTLD